MMASSARLAWLRIARGRRAWLTIALWMGVALAPALLERGHSAPRGASHVLTGVYGAIALPLLAYAVVAAALGAHGLARSALPVVRFGAEPRRVALGTLLVAAGASVVLGSVLGVSVSAIAHGAADPPLGQDLWRCMCIGACGGGAYAAYFGLGASMGARGLGRSVLLVVDWVFGVGTGTSALLTPRAHIRSLLGGSAPLDLPARGSYVALVAIGVVCAYWATRRVAQTQTPPRRRS